MDSNYHLNLTNWRKEYERKLAAPDGWLSISGLYWLKEGKNWLGSDPKCEVVLPPGSAPAKSGIFHFDGTLIHLEILGDIPVTLNEKPFTSGKIELREFGSSDWFTINQIKFAVIQRGIRFGVRVYDPNNPSRRQFVSLHWFPIDESYRVIADWIPLDPPKQLTITNVLGDTSSEPCVGYAEFTVDRQLCRLYPIVSEDDGRLWFMFKDASNGQFTYPGGRFLWADPPTSGQVVLDFNKAYNPPCAYTDFATCPLPPEENRLSVQILAGEMRFH